ncbi:MAG: hypothetical protein AAB295_06395 [Chloroflexota bacterium]
MPRFSDSLGRAQAERFTRDLLLLLARRFMSIARRKTESETIRRTLSARIDPQPGSAFVEAPQYWAPYYHDGRGPVRAKDSPFLVFYKDRRDDPRRPSNTMRAFQIRRLSAEEFVRDARAGKLIVRREVGPSKPHPFFTQAHAEFARPGALQGLVANAITTHLMRDFVRSERATVRLRL